MSDAGPAAGSPLSSGQFGDTTGTDDMPYTAQNPNGPLLGVWAMAKNVSQPRRKKHKPKHKK